MLRDLSDERRPSAPQGVDEPQIDRPVLRDLLTSFERNIIATALFAAGGNQKRAAAALGVLPTTFQEKLRRFGLVNLRPGRAARSGERAAGPGE
jgi:DNA-binding NtrC family response regulator